MSGLSAGLATFNSCNKAGSIPYFTHHLSRYPNDYRALTWRGRAHSIIGKTAEAKADFQKACRVSHGSQKLLAEAHIANIDGKREQKVAILQNTIRQYPNCSEAWHDLGGHTYRVEKKVDLSLQYLEKAKHLAAINSETRDPWYPWCNQTIGDIYFYQKKQVNEARKYYEAAVRSSYTLTIGHIGLSKCYIMNDDLARAKASFLTAKELNPVLVTCETFDDFRQKVQTEQIFNSSSLFDLASEISELFSALVVGAEALPHTSSGFQDVSSAGTRDTRTQRSSDFLQQLEYSTGGNKSRAHSRRSVSSYQGETSGGSQGSGGGSGGSDDDKTAPLTKEQLEEILEELQNDAPSVRRAPLTEKQRQQVWEKIKENAPSIKKCGNKRFYQSKNKKKWFSKIDVTERHGRETKSFLKRYVDKGATIQLEVSLDENMDEMLGKHESGKYGIIRKSDLVGVK